MTEHVKILGWIYVVVKAALLAVGLVVCVGLALDVSPASVSSSSLIAIRLDILTRSSFWGLVRNEFFNCHAFFRSSLWNRFCSGFLASSENCHQQGALHEVAGGID